MEKKVTEVLAFVIDAGGVEFCGAGGRCGGERCQSERAEGEDRKAIELVRASALKLLKPIPMAKPHKAAPKKETKGLIGAAQGFPSAATPQNENCSPIQTLYPHNPSHRNDNIFRKLWV